MENLKLKRLIGLAMTAVLLIGMTGCGGSKTSDNSSLSTSSLAQVKIDKPVTIEFWHAMTGPTEKELQKLADDFHKKNPNITVKLVGQGDYTTLSQKLMAAAKARTSPVMAQAYSNWMSDYISSDLLENLTPYYNDEKIGIKDKNDIVKSFLDDNTFNGKLYGVPFNKSTEVLIYNKDYLDKVGEKVPQTWDELKEVAKETTTTINGKKVIGLGFENSVTGDLATYVKQAGGEYVTDKGQVKFNSKAGEKALQFLTDMLVTDKTARLAGEDDFMSTPFGRGDVAMYIGSSAGVSYINDAVKGKFNWSTAVLPKDEDAASPFQGTNVVIFKNATAEEKVAAWEFGKFLASDQETAEWAEKTGYVPVTQSALKSEEWESYIKKNPDQQAAVDQFDNGFIDPHLNGYTKLRTDVSTVFNDVLIGKKSVSDGLNDAEKAAKQDLEQQ
jgi:multiple sugar transport system substrate-binding protein